MTYSSAIEYLYGLQKHGIKLGLETMRTLLGRLGHPERRFRSLHIGGTNGKGSTAAMTAAMLQAAGYRVGLYTSPHLVDFRERIRVNQTMIAEAQVAELTAQLQASVPSGLTPTFFELTTAMAFLHFAESGVDVAVLEVGMGGRFDATNVVEPVACAITTIALDHQEYLGTTEDAIAFEKAGIIKPGIPVVVGRIDGPAWEVIRRTAMDREAPLTRLGTDFYAASAGLGAVSYRGRSREFDGLTSALAGRHQLDNAACALALLDAAEGRGISVDEAAVRRGLASVLWEGRLEVVERGPVLLLDGAHNPAAAHVLAEYLTEWCASRPESRLILVLGMMRDKDHARFVEPFYRLISEAILTQVDMARSASVEELRETVGFRFSPCHVAPSTADALALAKARATVQDLICVTGSLMLVGEVKALVRGCGLSPLRG
ncbi:bifunctional folylpolyglutamate synthase/dihydrofolate synthase [Nitrospira lenta]|uniref:Dihydrofolate synthase/folylpolyglutamate synthase n=1 Tax=Nitrospira lenta TaxID=1436998 RepID=A0A330LCR9_9BACT|nr:folylpolyglutamate synthase/dihydrofolate synthase family protein [Nitrospira lenta]SPP66786.1 Bifunctional protein FolC: Folylpolyglutamate synthase and Dihydrofolate synthase [Nitrospira lenta]